MNWQQERMNEISILQIYKQVDIKYSRFHLQVIAGDHIQESRITGWKGVDVLGTKEV